MDTASNHLLLEYRGCDRALLDDPAAIRGLMEAAATAAGATLVQSVFHQFSPQGVTGVVVVEESHFSVHTWPEQGYAAVDVYTCGDCLPEKADELLRGGLRAQDWERMWLRRGLTGARGIQVAAHVSSRDEVSASEA